MWTYVRTPQEGAPTTYLRDAAFALHLVRVRFGYSGLFFFVFPSGLLLKKRGTSHVVQPVWLSTMSCLDLWLGANFEGHAVWSAVLVSQLQMHVVWLLNRAPLTTCHWTAWFFLRPVFARLWTVWVGRGLPNTPLA